jgi:LCP family protein required for cell wall assembly
VSIVITVVLIALASVAPASAGGVTGGTTGAPARINILVLGIDSHVEGVQTRSDIVMVVSVDPATGATAMLSIPRDSRVEISGHGRDKIGHAHAYGGVKLARETVAACLGLKLDYWVRLDMPGLVHLFDAFGPIPVDVPYPIVLDDQTRLEAGRVEMDAHLALLYAIERKSDPNGDVGRTSRAQGLMLAAVRHLSQRISIKDLPALYLAARRSVDTNISLKAGIELVRLAKTIGTEQVQHGVLPGQGVMDKGIWYYDVDWAAAAKTMAELGMISTGVGEGASPAPTPAGKGPVAPVAPIANSRRPLEPLT